MRAHCVVLWLAVGCAPSPTPPDAAVGACAGALPARATAIDGGVRVACDAFAIDVGALADGTIHLRYATTDAPAARSWAVLPAAIDPSAAIGGDGDTVALCTPAITVRLDDACRVHATLADGTMIVDDAAAFAAGGTARLQRTAAHDHVYGLGERTGGLERRGRAWSFWNTDAYDPAFGGWHPDQDPMYQSIPLELHLAAGEAFGVFTDVTRRMTIDLSDPAHDELAVDGARAIDQYLFAGPRLADVVDRYTRLTGRPAMPPRWALGFHQSRWGYANAAEVEAVAAQFRALAIPADAIWLDIQHLDGFRSFTFDPQGFADPAAMIARLAAIGFHVVTIEDPGLKVDPAWDVYNQGVAGGHFVRAADGSPYVGTAWPGSAAWPDFSRAATRTWWGQLVGGVLDRGVAGVWLDVNEPTTFPEGGGATTVPDELMVDGDGTPATMAELHNVYGTLEAGATFDAIAARGVRPFVLSRAGYAGIQRHAAAWTGDTPSTWDGLAQTLPMLLGLGLSGEPFVGSDIGGYSGNATPELYARWLALGSISPFARAHVTENVPGQEPWMFGAEVTELARDRLADRYRLMPYLYALADAAAQTGAPLLRPLVWEFPDDPAVAELADEAMLGPSLLVAPVVAAGATSRTVYLPAGRWFDLASDAIIDGPATIVASIRLAALPIYVRAGAIVPTWPAGPTGGLQLEVYPGAAATSFSTYDDDGETLGGAFARTAITLEPRSDGAHIAYARTGTLAVPARQVTVRVHRVDGAVTGVTVDGAPVATSYDADALALAATVPDADQLDFVFTYDPAITDPQPPVAVTFEVHVPTTTPTDAPICVATSATGWAQTPLTWTGPGIARGTVVAPRGVWFDYKYTRGTWDTVEKLADCSERANRDRAGAAGSRVDTVEAWRDRCP